MDAVVQWIQNGPEMPVELLQALEDGDLVLFCGAGVSVPAGLPLFKGLVQRVYEALPDKPAEVKDLIEHAAYDRALYVLEQECGRANVRKRIPPLLTIADGADLSTHSALLALARSRDGSSRLVTTNFDDGFERAGETPVVDCAPKLPIPKKERWNGLVHLHGRLDPSDPECSSLVLSSADFGLAYLTERWASRFVSELFKRFMVLFIGYSVEDPVMRYMMDAFAADRAIGEAWLKAFAFTGAKLEDFDRERRRWRNKGIQAIPYSVEGDDHGLLHETLKHWAGSHRQGMQGKDAIVRDNCQRPMVALAAKQVCWALRDDTGHPARVFAEVEPVAPFEWVDILERNGLLAIQNPTEAPNSQFVSGSPARGPGLHQRTVPLIAWSLKYMGDARFVRWVIDHGSCLHPDAVWMIRSELRQAQLPAGLAKFWRIVASVDFSRSFVPSNCDPWLFESLGKGEWSPVMRADIADALTPLLRIGPPWPSIDDKSRPQDRFSTFAHGEVRLRGQHEVGMLRQSIDKSPHRIRILVELADDLTTQLKRAYDLLALIDEAGEWYDTSYVVRPSIDDHGQNTDVASWTDLIPLVRDCLLVTATSAPNIAAGVVNRWKAFRFPLFRRLIYYAASKTALLNSREAIDCLLEDEGRGLWLHFTQHEAFQMLEAIWPKLEEQDSRRLISAILAGPNRDLYRAEISDDEFENIKRELIVKRLQLLRGTSRALPNDAAGILESIKAPKQSHEQLERASFPFYSQRTWGDPFLRRIDPDADLRSLSDPEARRILLTVESNLPYLTSWRAMIRENLSRAISILVDTEETSWPAAVLSELIGNLPLHSPGQVDWMRLCPALVRANRITSVSDPLAFALREASKLAEGFLDEACLFELWDLIADPVLTIENSLSEHAVEQALNEPAGALAECIFNRLEVNSKNGADKVPRSIWARLEKLAVARDNGATLAHVILASRLAFLFWLDQAWAETYLVPLLDWQTNPHAGSLWQGFLWQFSVAPDLWPKIKTSFLLAFKNQARLGETVEAAASWFAAICIDQPGWIEAESATEVLKELPPKARAAAANVIWRKMEGSEESADALWRERIGPWLNSSWPRSSELRDPAVSTNLAMAALQTRAEFPVAVNTILEVIGQGDISLVAWQLEQLKTKHSQEHPLELLELMSTLLDASQKTYDHKIRTALQEISAASPAYVNSPEYRKIDDWLSKQGL